VEQVHPPSLFLADIPTSCVQDFSSGAVLEMARQPWVAASTSTSIAVGADTAVRKPVATRAASTAATPYGVGTQVHHQHFGRGVVQKREGNGDQLKLTVVFRDHGIKKVLAKFAPMQPL
jgi:hypothetical protein